MIAGVLLRKFPFVDFDPQRNDDVQNDAEHFEHVVSPHAFVLRLNIFVGVCPGANPNIRKIFSRQKRQEELSKKGEDEGPAVEEVAPELVVECGRIF